MGAPRQPADPQAMEIIDAYIEHLRQAQCTDQTMDYRRELLCRLDRELPFGIGQVYKTDLAKWLYRDEWSQNTKATYFRTIKSFYDWATDPAEPWLSGANPAAGLDRVRTADSVARAATDEQVREIMLRAAEPFRTWAMLAAYQGLRAIEISRLDREHVTQQQLFVVRGKGGKPRVHDTDPVVWAAVKGLRPGPIARHPETGQRASDHYVAVYTRDYLRRKLKIHTSLHPLRHWLGTTVQREYKDVRVTQRMLGHAQLSSTMIYTDATDEQQRAARATLPRFA